MRHFRTSVQIEAPVERVWAVVARAERMPEWQSNIVEIKEVSGPLETVGASYVVVAHVPPGRRTEDRWEVTDVEVGRVLEATGAAPMGGSMRARNTLVALDGPSGARTELTIEMDYDLPPGIVGKVTDRIFQHAVQASNTKLKQIVEAEARRA